MRAETPDWHQVFLFMTLLSKFESVKIYWLSVKFDWFKYLKRGYCKSVKFTDLTVKNIFFTDESVKINWFNSGTYFFTDESVNFTDSDLESRANIILHVCILSFLCSFFFYTRQKLCSWYKETYRCFSYIINYPNHKYGWYNLKNLCDSYIFFPCLEIGFV